MLPTLSLGPTCLRVNLLTTLSTANLEGIGEAGGANERLSSAVGIGGWPVGDSPLSKAWRKDGMGPGGQDPVDVRATDDETIGSGGMLDDVDTDIGGGKSLPTGSGNFPPKDGNTFWSIIGNLTPGGSIGGPMVRAGAFSSPNWFPPFTGCPKMLKTY